VHLVPGPVSVVKSHGAPTVVGVGVNSALQCSGVGVTVKAPKPGLGDASVDGEGWFLCEFWQFPRRALFDRVGAKPRYTHMPNPANTVLW
jgi:hypothetical protein